MTASRADSAAGLLEGASRGRLPSWAAASPSRQSHMQRVSSLMEEWARALDLGDTAVARWRAVGLLHDVLREAPPGELRRIVAPGFRTLPAPLLHGPAAAERLRLAGVEDEDFLRAVAFHTIGHPDLDLMGRALYCADHLEPGRRGDAVWRVTRRDRFPEEPRAVTVDVVRERIRLNLDVERVIPAETTAFWNTLMGEATDGGAKT